MSSSVTSMPYEKRDEAIEGKVLWRKASRKGAGMRNEKSFETK